MPPIEVRKFRVNNYKVGDPNELITKEIALDKANDLANYWFGLALMFINKIRRKFAGYTSTRGFSDNEIDKAIAHSWNITSRYYSYLDDYNPELSNMHFDGKKILELGPGSDLGTAVIGKALGANNYCGLDIFPLAYEAPPQIYKGIFDKLVSEDFSSENVDQARVALENWQAKRDSSIQYIVDKQFNLLNNELSSFDYIVSNAAFQQFSNVEQTISEISQLINPGGIFVSLIDLSTHTRWIGHRDPFNIYRYSNRLYNLLSFKGSPNRLRPEDYTELFEKYGWSNVKIYKRITANPDYIRKIKKSLTFPYKSKKMDMSALTVIICARKQ